ncbi:MAG: hypothetical protein ACLFP8_02765 [Alphaproteobacteria bacterium]
MRRLSIIICALVLFLSTPASAVILTAHEMFHCAEDQDTWVAKGCKEKIELDFYHAFMPLNNSHYLCTDFPEFKQGLYYETLHTFFKGLPNTVSIKLKHNKKAIKVPRKQLLITDFVKLVVENVDYCSFVDVD